jgi:enamine deaminase RidA (YjgF/YER057c/UK114 family)
MNYRINPRSISSPVGNHSHAILTTGVNSFLHTSGIAPIAIDGTTPAETGDQAQLIWETAKTILADAHMKPQDVISTTTYVVIGEDLNSLTEERDKFFSGHQPAATTISIPALADKAWKVEISIVAAKSAAS